MKSNNYPGFIKRLLSVWYRHFRVYVSHLVSNGLPPFLEPLIFLAGIGLGLGGYIDQQMGNLDYLQFLASGLLVTSAMYTASFECTFGTFIRLEFDKVYDGMLGTPITANDLLIGEIFWAGTKGFFYTLAVLSILLITGIIEPGFSLLTPFVGFLVGLVFAGLSFLVTSFVTTINHFNFYFTGVLTPLFVVSGVFFPVEDLPAFIRPFSEAMPLVHAVRLVRALSFANFDVSLLWDLGYLLLFIPLLGWIAVSRLRKRLID